MSSDSNIWKKYLKFTPISPLVLSENKAINYFVRRDILEEDPGNVESLWEMPQVISLLAQQQNDGSWNYSGRKGEIRSKMNFNQLETYRTLRILVDKYGLNNTNNAISKAAEFLFSFQSEEGDFRGIYENQYTPNYSAAIMEILIKSGYGKDYRIDQGIKWLISIRQNDGGWAIPFRTVDKNIKDTLSDEKPLLNNPERKSSHLITGIVLRAFAAHDHYRKSIEARKAGGFLKSQFFKKDYYPDHGTPDYWEKLCYPFWWTDIVSALDSLSKLRFTVEDSDIRKGLKYLIQNQRLDGTWKVYYGLPKDPDNNLWITLAICRIFKKYFTR